MAEVCTVRRQRDGKPCWRRTHHDPVHVTEDWGVFMVATDQWRNRNLAAGDPLRDAPEALRSKP